MEEPRDQGILIPCPKLENIDMQNNKPPLPKEISAQLDALAYQLGDARRAGDAAQWSDLSEQAWDLLPDPKTEWDYYPQTISRNAVEISSSFGLCDQLDVRIGRFYATHFDTGRQSEYTNLIVGHALFQCNRQEEAVVLFRHVLANHGPQWFMGNYRSYLELAEKS